MAHFADLTPCNYFPASEDTPFLAVGWLEPAHEYSRGEVSEEFFIKLCELLRNPWQPPIACAGIHRCAFCRFTGGTTQSTFRDYQLDGAGNGFLFVPSGNTVYVSPSNVAHYVDAHEYRPPQEFQDAVMKCPEMRSAAYLRALLATPVKAWLEQISK